MSLTATLAGQAPVAVEWAGPLQRATKHPLTAESAREQLGRLGETPFELGEVSLELPAPVMVPKSVLNELRRAAVERLLANETAAAPVTVDEPAALEHWRAEISQRRPLPAPSDPAAEPALHVLARTMEQLAAAVEWSQREPAHQLGMIYCDFEDVRRYRDAVNLARSVGHPIGLATLRISKPEEEGLLRQIARQEPDAFLVRNLAALTLLREIAPQVTRVGDFSLNIANELTADLLLTEGLSRVVPSYDLNWDQLVALVGRIDPGIFEVVVHQHMPMFHMEHCVFAALLSSGKDFRDCGRPCDHHRLELRDRAGAPFPVLADTGCRNTVFNSAAQSAAEYLGRMRTLGLRHFRVELLRESGADLAPLLDRYWRVLHGEESGRDTWRQLRVLNQLGVTRGTLTAD
ncbi:MAG: DUF3656 domain-containing protein [Planctomycetaceae bacterium]|nr:DUF3656 domain-containing protein [Planctomycetaceae bacterium]